jgi:trimeric autotransporter adhesin
MGACLAIVAGVALISAGGASAVTLSPNVAATAPCNVTVTGGGQLVPGTTLITGVVAGKTQIMFDCNASSGADLAAEASLLAGLSATSVSQTSLADTSSLGTFTASATDTGCPAATAGSCTIATFAVPATFTASDSNAQCPPTQAQINAGVFGCAVAVATAAEAEVPGGEYLLQYASQATAPNAPTISALQTSGSPGSLINVSDATANTGYWWGSAVQAIQAQDAGAAPAVAPSTCGSGGGYGNVPSSLLVEAWYAAGSSTPASTGPATGVTISNDCYSSGTLDGPVLGGTMTVPATVSTGTSYTVYLCEVNSTPYPSNSSSSAQVCGSPAPYVDSSFTFSVTAKSLSQNLPNAGSVTAADSTGFTAQLASSGNTGTVTYTQSAGSPSLKVSGAGAVTTSGALKAGSYTASGTTADPNGDSGTFTYTLTVTGASVTPPPVKPPSPTAVRVIGWGIIGHTDIVVITGHNFTAGARIIGHAGTVASLVRYSSTHLYVRVRVVSSARRGTYRFIIQFRDGKRTSVTYTIR